MLATVYGDVHDIGKNLVKTILSNNGYDVIDLGKQVPAETIITQGGRGQCHRHRALGAAGVHLQADAADHQRAAPPQPALPGAGRRRGHQPPLWAPHPVHRGWQCSRAGVFYCKDAFEGLETMDQLIVPEKREELLAQVLRERRYGDGPRLAGTGAPQDRRHALQHPAGTDRAIRSNGASASSRICRWRSSCGISA